jgi:hypothetical protein
MLKATSLYTVLQTVKTALPKGIYWTENLSGMCLFPWYDPTTGAPKASEIVMLNKAPLSAMMPMRLDGGSFVLPSEGLVVDPDGWAYITVELDRCMTESDIVKTIKEAAEQLQRV